MSAQRVFGIGALGLLATSALLAGTVPVAVSPGDAAKLTLIGDICPTFSWGEVEGAAGYEIVVYRLGGEGEEEKPVLQQQLAGSVYGWTPPLAYCLELGGQYAWSVRAVGRKGATEWSVPSLFEVTSGPSEVEFEQALAVVRDYLAGSGPNLVEIENGVTSK